MSHETKTIAVLGAGTMGRGIAHVSALAGYATQLFDTSAEALKKAESTVHRNLAKGVEIGKVKADAAETARRNLQTQTDPAAAVAEADLVIEAVPEDMALKIRMFGEVASACPEHALFASNTSALSIAEMAAASGRAERFAGMHFFNPVHVMRLIELVKGLQTSPETPEDLRRAGGGGGRGARAAPACPSSPRSRGGA